MGKFNIPRIARPVDLARYAPELAQEIGQAPAPIYMWVNPSRDARAEYVAIRREGRAILLALREAIAAQDAEGAAKMAVEDLTRQAAAIDHRVAAWWATAWSQGAPESRWTVEEVEALIVDCSDKDPGLWEFITNECWRMVAEHRESARKN